MVNPRLITSKLTKAESKDLLDKAQGFIDRNIKGEKFKRDELLKKKSKRKRTRVKIDGEDAGETVDGELVGNVKTRTKVPKPDEKTDQILFNVKAGGKITPKMLADFNINKINTKGDILKFIEEVSQKYKKDIGNRKRGVQSQEDTKQLANLLQKDQTKLSATLLNLKKGETLNAEYILATRELVEASYAKLDKLAQKAITGTPDDILAFRQHMALTSQLTKILKGVQTETARALNQFKIPTSGKNRFGNVNLDELNKRDFLIEIGGEDEIRGFAKVYLKEIDSGTARVKMVENIGTATKIADAFSEVFINAILSNPLTHVRNTAGNWITQGIIATEHKLASRLYGGKAEGGLAKYEDIARAYGKTQAYTEMWGAIGRSLKKGEMPTIDSMIQGTKVETRAGKFTADFFNQDAGSVGAKFTDFTGKVLTLNRIPTRFLTVADNYFKNLEYRSELYTLAYRKTLSKIDEGTLSKDKAAEYLADLVVNPTKSMVDEAFEAAKYSTFQTKLGTRGDILDKGADIQRFKGKLGPANFIANYYLPFIQTPTNITGFVMERTPGVNLLLKSYRNELFSNNPARVQKAKAKMMLGSAFFLTVMGMNYGGVATGTSPSMNTKNPSAKYGMKKTLGINSGTINIPYGDETIRVDVRNVAFDPLAMAFKMAADFSEILQMGFADNDQWQDYLRMLTAFTYSVGENLASSTFMSGVGNAISDYQSIKQLGGRGLKRVGQKMFTSTFVPGIVRQGAQIVDVAQGQKDQTIAVEFKEYFQKTLRYNELNKQYDYLGDRVENWGVYTTEKKDPIRDELRKTKVEILPVKRSKVFSGGKSGLTANVEYNSEELSFLQKRSGEYTKIILENVIGSDEYQDNDNFYKQALIKKSVSKARSAAYNDMIGVEFRDSLGSWEKSEETATRLNDEKLRILENKVITSNFGEPLTTPFASYMEE